MELDHEISDLIAADITQKIVRSQCDGTDRIVAIFRCDLEAGQDKFVLNVPIHPPMENVPEVEAVIIHGSGRTRITDRKKFGVRIELSAPANSTESQLYLETIISTELL